MCAGGLLASPQFSPRSLSKSHSGPLANSHDSPAPCGPSPSLPPCPHPPCPPPLCLMWEGSFARSSTLSSKMNSSQTANVRTKQAFMSSAHSHVSPPQNSGNKYIYERVSVATTIMKVQTGACVTVETWEMPDSDRAWYLSDPTLASRRPLK